MKNKLIALIVALFIGNACAAEPKGSLVVNIDLFIAACGKKESHNNPHAIGDKHLKEKAYGFLQIRQPCADDVNRRHGTKLRAEQMLGNRELSIWVCQKYLELYATRERLGRDPTYQDFARIWNGGPCGVFDNGAIDKKGNLLKNPKARARLASAQANAKRYSLDILKIMGSPLIAQR